MESDDKDSDLILYVREHADEIMAASNYLSEIVNLAGGIKVDNVENRAKFAAELRSNAALLKGHAQVIKSLLWLGLTVDSHKRATARPPRGQPGRSR